MSSEIRAAEATPAADIGLTGPSAFPITFWAQVMAPLRWKQIECESDAPGAPGAG